MTSRLAHWNTPTLNSAELQVDDLGVDDQLVLRDVKAKLFDRDIPVTVGRYPIERRIGRGGMGTVYEGVDPELGRKVALKMMLPGDSNAARTKAEARTLAQLSHPNVVTVHEVGQHRERVFLAMEYVEGETLGDWLARGPSTAAILEVFGQAGAGLAAAHEAGITHRDFKPSNVLIREDGRVKVIDFGLSHAAIEAAGEDEGGSVRLTRTGALLGTPAYMSPEQFRGEPLDARTDVFSFGAVLYEALTGSRPFAGKDVASIRAAFEGGAPRRDKRIPRKLWPALSAALRTDPRRRPASLRPLLDGMKPGRNGWWPMVGVGLALAGTAAASTMDERPTTVVADVPTTEEPVDSERARAFAVLRDTKELETRKSAAESFLATYGDDVTNAEQLIAEASIGLALRARSCTSDFHGLCVRRVDHVESKARCPQAPKATLVTVQRDEDLYLASEQHLEKARALMSFQKPPKDDVGAKAYYGAVSAVRLAAADRDLETMLATTVPDILDFEGGENRELTREAFQAILDRNSALGAQVQESYATLKRGGDPQLVLEAAARTAVSYLSFVWLLASVPNPKSLSDEETQQYCRVIDRQWQPMVQSAHDAVDYCTENAEAHDLDGSRCNPIPDGFPQVVP